MDEPTSAAAGGRDGAAAAMAEEGLIMAAAAAAGAPTGVASTADAAAGGGEMSAAAHGTDGGAGDVAPGRAAPTHGTAAAGHAAGRTVAAAGAPTAQDPPQNASPSQASAHQPGPGYEYPTPNYYPTYPANASPAMPRYDSGIFDTGTSDDDEDEDEYDLTKSTQSSDVGTSVDEYDNSSADGLLIDDEDAMLCLGDEGTSHTHSTHEAADNEPTSSSSLFEVEENHAASAPSLLAGLPHSHKPFQDGPGSHDGSDVDYSYISTQPWDAHAGESPSPTGDGSPFSAYGKGANAKARARLSAKNTSRTYKPYDSESHPLPPVPLHTLPIDALHNVSSYCTPADWTNLGTSNKVWRGIAREVFAKVWRHAGKCMAEVGMAWAKGEHADARELASLYLSKGVPLYPAPHGHAYHTLVWRMGLELEAFGPNGPGGQGGEDAAVGAEGTERNGGAGGNDGAAGSGNNREDEGSNVPTDPFYADRYVDNPQDHRDVFSRNHMTYVEEKSVFWKKKKGIEVPSGSHSPFPPSPQARGALFPRRFSFTGANATVARGPPPDAWPPPPPGAGGAAPGGGMTALGMPDRPGTAVPGPRPPHARSAAEAAGAPDPPAAAAAAGTPRYVRRSSFSGTTGSSSGSTPRRTSELDHGISSRSAVRRASLRNALQASAAGPPPSAPPTPPAPKMTLRIHRHLADQHLFGSPSVNDENGTMEAGKLSMSADFYHPTWEARRGLSNAKVSRWDGTGWGASADGVNGSGDGAPTESLVDPALDGEAIEIGETVDQEGEEAMGNPNPRADTANYRAAVRAFVNWTLANATDRPGNNARRNSLPPGNTAAGRLHALLSSTSAWRTIHDGPGSRPAGLSPASDVHLEVYSAASINLKSENGTNNAVSDAVAEMLALCKRYQKRLDSLLRSNCDAFTFQEAILDYWDEILATTKGIHYYNQQSPVPRMSQLHSFLVNPCPRALGTIQCEIERVKVSSKNKGKKMKGKLFPSYEYRLFIRDTKNDNPFNASRAPPRKDTVLLVAKNKGGKNRTVSSERNGSGVGGLEFATPASVASPGSRRGVTNYYMCLPDQRDVDGHYKSTNRNNSNAELRPGEASGLAVSPVARASSKARGGPGAVEVGRLQSNFIGTEFQIFVPKKTAPRNVQSLDQPQALLDTSSEGGIEGDRKVHPIDAAVPPTASNANTPRRSIGRRGSGLVRLARRASGHLSRRASRRNSEEPLEEPVRDERQQRRGSKKTMRRMSWGSKSLTDKRANRRAVANDSESCYDASAHSLSSSIHNAPAAMGEVENGAITYTANLLGNRPRIMDVCIPKLMDDGRVCEQWRGNRESGGSNAGAGATSMLEIFKTMQQSMENLEGNAGPNNQDNAPNAAAANRQGLMVLQNRPPWWNIELGAFVLNFGGRVKVASVKNFQLCERNDRDHIMQFGRIEGRHSFTMDFGWPLTPMQAFAIAISSLQSKISFG